MGQKVHPYGFRLGYNKNWLSRWYSKKDYPAFVLQDDQVRKFVKKNCFKLACPVSKSSGPAVRFA